MRAVHVFKDKGRPLLYHGDEVLAVAADSEEIAEDALRAVKIEYDRKPGSYKDQDFIWPVTFKRNTTLSASATFYLVTGKKDPIKIKATGPDKLELGETATTVAIANAATSPASTRMVPSRSPNSSLGVARVSIGRARGPTHDANYLSLRRFDSIDAC